jgi:hypothetical protein
MGWLFAVVLGLQERRRSAVLRALPAIAVGHEASIALVAVLVALAQVFAAADLLRPLGALALIVFGGYKLVRPRSHPRWAGLRVGLRDLVVWSLLMSSAHGAGLMLLPVLLGLPPTSEEPDLPVFGLDPANWRRTVWPCSFTPSPCWLSWALSLLRCMRSWASACCDAPGSTSTSCGR